MRTELQNSKIITLCGSTKFKKAFLEMNEKLTLLGNIVISVGVFGHSDKKKISKATKEMLDSIHKEKIDLADEIFVIDVGRYVGESTKSEIAYATAQGKPVRYYSQYLLQESFEQLQEESHLSEKYPLVFSPLKTNVYEQAKALLPEFRYTPNVCALEDGRIQFVWLLQRDEENKREDCFSITLDGTKYVTFEEYRYGSETARVLYQNTWFLNFYTLEDLLKAMEAFYSIDTSVYISEKQTQQKNKEIAVQRAKNEREQAREEAKKQKELEKARKEQEKTRKLEEKAKLGQDKAQKRLQKELEKKIKAEQKAATPKKRGRPKTKKVEENE